MYIETQTLIYVIGGLLGAAALAGFIIADRFRDLHADHAGALSERVDPWAMQRELMDISGQKVPDSPRLTDGALLYAALLMEESAETYDGIIMAFVHWYGVETPTGLSMADAPQAVQQMHTVLCHVRNSSAQGSRLMRETLATKPAVDLPLGPEIALPIFDGTIDVAVVNSGFALACGFPGSAGYAEVGNSNLSKKNPDTGVIDKDAGGKWIKGILYREPDLAGVLRQHEVRAGVKSVLSERGVVSSLGAGYPAKAEAPRP